MVLGDSLSNRRRCGTVLKKVKKFLKFLCSFPQPVEIVENLGDMLCRLWKTENPSPGCLLDKRPKWFNVALPEN
jgi:hypothetical protein